MTEITRATIADFCLSGEFEIGASVSADEDEKKAGNSVNVILRFKMSQTPLSEVICSSLKDKRINWQTKGRKETEKLKAGQIISLDYKGGRAPVVMSFDQALAYGKSLPEDERELFIAQLKATK